MTRHHPSLARWSTHSLILAALAVLPALRAHAQPYNLTLKQITFRSLEKKSAGAPIVNLPDIGRPASATVPFNHAVSGSITTLSNCSVTVSAPSSTTATDGPLGGTLTVALTGGSHVTMNATWTPSEDAEFLAQCQVEGHGPQGSFDGEAGVPVSPEGTLNFGGSSIAFAYGESGTE